MGRIVMGLAALALVLWLVAGAPAQAQTHEKHHRCSAYDASIDWEEVPYEHFTICYTAVHADDVSWVANWLNYAHWRLAAKYGVTELRTVRDVSPEDPGDAYQGGPDGARMHVNVMLLPQPDANADTGTTRFMISWGHPAAHALHGPIADRVRHAFIPYVTPSAPDWSAATRWGVLQAPAWDFHAKNLMHQYTHAVQHTVRYGEPEQRLDWRHPVPQWLIEGLAEFEGGAHTTDYYRTTGYGRLVRYVVEEIPDQVFLHHRATLADTETAAAITTTDAYFGGRLILHYLGEDVHARLVRHEYPTFTAALTAELAAAGLTMEEAWAGLRAWVAAEYAALL